MKAKKILFLVSGILKSIVGGCLTLLSLMMLLFKNTFRDLFTESVEFMNELVATMAGSDPNNAHMYEWTPEQQAEFLIGILTIISIVVLVIALITILVAVCNFRFYKKAGQFRHEKAKSITLAIICWLVNPLFLSTLLTTIAVCIPGHAKIKDSPTISLEEYQL